MKKSDRIFKKALSLLLVFVMLAGTMELGFGGLLSMFSLKASAADGITISVPETIYLDPNDRQTFQYYYNNNADGSVTAGSTYENSGKLYFTASGVSTSNVSITGTLNGTTITGTGGTVSLANAAVSSSTYSCTISGALPAAQAEKTSTVIKWTISYNSKTYYAYTTVYAPFVGTSSVAAAMTASNYKSDLHDDPYATGTYWITGGHSVTTEGYASDFYEDHTSKSYSFYGNPLLTSSEVLTGGSDENRQVYHNLSASSARLPANLPAGSGMYGTYLGYAAQDEDVKTWGGTLQLAIDPSRITNYSQVPNLMVGYDVNHTHKIDHVDEAWLHVTSAKNGKEKEFKDDALSTGRKVNQHFTGSIVAGRLTLESYYQTYYDSAGSSNELHIYNYIYLNTTEVDKTNLRTQVQKAMNTFTGAEIDKGMSKQYEAACLVLGQPDATVGECNDAETSLKAAMAAMSGAYEEYKIDFVVPETIYLVPAASGVKSFQYYLNNNNDGTAKTGDNAYESTGSVYFNCDAATSVSISCDAAKVNGVTAGSAVFSASAKTVSGTINNSTSSALSELNTGISPGGKSTITWTATYTVHGQTFTAKNYTVCYAPAYSVAASCVGRCRDDLYLRNTAFISGAHSVSSTQLAYLGNESSENTITGNLGVYDPVIDINTPYYAAHNSNDTRVTQSGTWIRSLYESDNEEDRYKKSYLGYLSYDYSRTKKLSEIPNFYLGIEMNDAGNKGSSNDDYGPMFRGYYYYGTLSTGKSGESWTGYNNNPVGNAGWNYLVNAPDSGSTCTKGTGVVYASALTEPTSALKVFNTIGASNPKKAMRWYIKPSSDLASSGTTYAISWAQGCRRYNESSGSRYYGNSYAEVQLTACNKTDMRKTYYDAIRLGCQQAWYTEASWNTFSSALKTVGEKLGDVTSTDNSVTNLQNAIAGLTFKTGVLKSRDVSATGKVLEQYNDQPYNYGQTVTAETPANGYDGYTYSGFTNHMELFDFDGWATNTVSTALGGSGHTSTDIITINRQNKTIRVTGGTDKVVEGKASNDIYTTYSTAGCYKMFCKPSHTYHVHADISAATGAPQFFVFAYKDNGSGGAQATDKVDNKDTWICYSIYAAGTVDRDITTPADAEWFEIRVGVSAANSDVTISNIQIYDKDTGLYGHGTGDTTLTYYNPCVPDINVNFNYTPDLYTATFHPNGGTWSGGATGDKTSASYTVETVLQAPAAISKTGYTFDGWKVTKPAGNWQENNTYGTAADTTEVAGAVDMYGAAEFTAQWEANTITLSYAAGDGSGTAPTSPLSFTYGTNTTNLPANTFTAPAGGYTVNYNYDNATGGNSASSATAAYTFANWKSNANNSTYAAGAAITDNLGATSGEVTLTAQWKIGSVTLPTPTKTGYTFDGWYTASGFTGDRYAAGASFTPTAATTNMYAKWKANTDTAYKVEHYVMGTNGSYPTTATKTENKTGTTGATLTLANLKDTTQEVTNGIVYKEGKVGTTVQTSTTIAADGTTVVKLYYERKQYALTLSKGTGIASVTGAGTYYYGQSVNIDATVSTGYTWSKWSDNNTTMTRTYTMPAAATTLTANATANTNTAYKVEHYQMNVGGSGYTLKETENLSGTTGASVTATAKTYTGFEYNSAASGTVASGTIAGNGSLVLKLYYTRKQYTLTLSKGTGIASVTGAGTYYYGQSVSIDATVSTGYTWSKWSDNDTTKTRTYTMPAAATTLTANATVNGYTVTYDYATNGGTSATKTTATVNYGAAVDLTPTATKSGYTFVGWTDSSTGTSKLDSKTMPASNLTLYAIYKKDVTATFYYWNGTAQASTTVSGTLFNNAAGVEITAPTLANATKDSVTYTPRGWCTTDAGDGTATVASAGKVSISANTSYYGMYSASITGTFYYCTEAAASTAFTNAGQTSTTATATRYMNSSGTYVQSNFTVPAAVTGSHATTCAESYKGVSTSANNKTTATPTTANTTFYAVYGETLTLYYYNGTAHTSSQIQRYMLSSGASGKYSVSTDTVPTPSAFDGAAFTTWTYDPTHIEQSYERTPTTTGNNSLYAKYKKTVSLVYDANTGTNPPADTTGDCVYVTKSAGAYNTNAPTLTVTTAEPTKTGYTFNKWNTADNGSGTDYAAGASITGRTSNLTLYAQWTANQYNITYKDQGNVAFSGAHESGYPTTHTYDTATTLKTASKTGYTFDGWFTASACTGTAVTSLGATAYTANITLYAKWTADNYTITYEGIKDATNPNTTTSYTIESSAIEFENASKTGYTFTGWTLTGATFATGSVISGTATNKAKIATGSYGNVTATAGWTINSYTVTVNNDGHGTASSTPSGSVNYNATVTLTATPATGYSFKEWTSSDVTVNDNKFTMPAKNVTVKANFKANTYTVTLNAGDGTGGTASVTATYDAAMPTATMPTRTGYTFGGYYDGENGSGTQYYTAAGASARNWNKTAATTLYAKWTGIGYTVTFNANGHGTPSQGTMSVTYGSTYGTLATISADGYQFDGWYTAATGGTKVESTTTVSTNSDHTLYAHWTDIVKPTAAITFSNTSLSATKQVTLGGTDNEGITAYYWGTSASGDTFTTVTSNKNWSATIDVSAAGTYYLRTKDAAGNISDNASITFCKTTFKANYGSVADTVSLNKSGDKITFNPTRTAYTFAGWYTAASGGTKKDTNGSVTVADQTLYAHWSPIAYKITYDVNGGTSISATDYNVESAAFNLPTATKTGYTFKNWKVTSTGGNWTDVNTTYAGNASVATGRYGNVTLQAQYEINSYTLKVVAGANGTVVCTSHTDATGASGVSVNYNTTVSGITATANTGYHFTSWTVTGTTPAGFNTSTASAQSFNMPDSNVTLTANFAANTNTAYKVEHYVMGTDGNYPSTATTTDNETGTTGATLTLASLKRDNLEVTNGIAYKEGKVGGAVATETTIAADGSTVVKLYYERIKHTLTLTASTGIASVSGADTYYYGQSVSVSATAAAGYKNPKWNNTPPTTMPANNVSLTATATPITYTITYTLNGGTNAAANPADYTVETETITLADPTRTGYTFTGWTGSNGTTPQKGITITKGSTGDKEYTANWSANVYNITYMDQGNVAFSGTHADDHPTTHTYGTATTLKSASKTGYTFGGWFTTSDCSGTAVETLAADGYTANITLYAKWTANTYKVKYDGNGATSGTTADSTHTYDAAKKLTANGFARAYTVTYSYDGATGGNTIENDTANYTFAGWAATATATEIAYADQQSVTNLADAQGAEVTLFAKWTPASVTLPTPTKTGYTFEGWHVGTTSGTKVTGTTYTPSALTTLCAVWTINQYTITFVTNGGSTIEPITQDYNTTVTAPAAPTRDGYTFANWCSDEGLTKTTTVPATMPAANTTLYAKWNPVTYNIRYDLNGGTVATVNPATYTVVTESFTLTNPTKTGYTFIGWTGSNGDTASTEVTITKGSTGDKSYTANWTADTFKLQYNANAASESVTDMPVTNPQTLTYDAACTISSATPKRTGYTFIGWATSASGSAEYHENGNVAKETVNAWYGTSGVGKGGTFNLYAKWEQSAFTLTFDANGGTFTSGNGFTAGSAQSKQIINGQKYGAEDNGKTWPENPTLTVGKGTYTSTVPFIGWFTEQNGGTAITSDTDVSNVTAPVTLYARFNYVAANEDLAEIAMKLNANHYTLASLKAVDTALGAIKGSSGAKTEETLNGLLTAMNALETLPDDGGAPAFHVFENKEVARTEIAGKTYSQAGSETVDSIFADTSAYGDIGYVYPGKCYYTYHCYTNSENPVILVSTEDFAGAGNHVSYPTKFAGDGANNVIKTESGTVNSGWMSYNRDGALGSGDRKALYEVGSQTVANPYDKELTYVGSICGDGTDYSYYQGAGYLVLKPTFIKSTSSKQFALYTISAYDDSMNGQVANNAKLAGADNYGTFKDVGTDLTAPENPAITPRNTITIYVEYFNSMCPDNDNGGYRTDAGGQVTKAGGIGTDNGKYLSVYTAFTDDAKTKPDMKDSKLSKWNTVDYLYRVSGGFTSSEATTNFIIPQAEPASGQKYKEYLGNDPQFGQNNIGSFYYLLDPTEAATEAYWAAYDEAIQGNESDTTAARKAAAAAATAVMNEKVRDDMKNGTLNYAALNKQQQAIVATFGDYISWPFSTSTRSSTQFYAPAKRREEALVYVHIYDRYGNEFTTVLQRNFQDLEAPTIASASVGQVTINETGYSSIRELRLTQYTYGGSNLYVERIGGQTDKDGWTVNGNTFTMTNLGPGNHNYVYTLSAIDNAGNVVKLDIAADPTVEGGSISVTVNDICMGGDYAKAAMGGQTNDEDDPTSAPVPSANEEDAQTMTGIEMARIAEEQIVGADTPTQKRANELPEVYSFKLNETYTVNLFVQPPHTHDFTNGDYLINDDKTHQQKCGDCEEYGEKIAHTFVKGKCVCGAELAPKNSASLTLNGEIVTNFRLDLEAYANIADVDVSSLTVRATYNANSNTAYEDVQKSVDSQADDLAQESDGRYKLSIAQAPAQIAEKITVEIYNNDTKLGKIECCGKLYADTLMEQTAEDMSMSEEMLAAYKNLCVAMVNYADRAQKYFKCSKPVITADDADTYNCALPANVDGAKFSISGNDITANSVTFMSLSNSALRIYYDGNVTDVSVSNGKSVTVNAEKKYIEVSGFAASELDDMFTITVNGTTTIETNALIYAKLGITSSNVLLKEFCASIALYNAAANAVFDN